MPFPVLSRPAIAVAIALLVSCTVESPGSAAGGAAATNAAVTAPDTGTADDSRLEPWIAKGRVTDSAGNPLAGVQVRATHTMFHASHLYATTDAEGRYRIELSGVQPSSWRVGAAIEREFEGTRYVQALHVDSHDGFPGSEGAVRHLEWRTGGEDGNGSWHGASAPVLQAGEGRVDGRQLVLRLEPLALIDGRSGGPLELRVDGDVVHGIPIGRYRASVRHEPPGGPRRALAVRDAERGDAAFAPTVELSVRDDRHGYPVLPVEVEVPAGVEWTR